MSRSFWDEFISNNLESRLDVLITLKASNSPVLDKIRDEYVDTYGLSAARYMISNLEAWRDRTVEMQRGTIYRVKRMNFPVISGSEQDSIVKALYNDWRENNPEIQKAKVILGYNEDESVTRLRDLVEGYRSNPYETDVALWSCYEGIRWICRENFRLARTLLSQLAREEGKSIYHEAREQIELFINQLQRGECSPGKYTIPLPAKGVPGFPFEESWYVVIEITVRYPNFFDKTSRRIRGAALALRSRWRKIVRKPARS